MLPYSLLRTYKVPFQNPLENLKQLSLVLCNCYCKSTPLRCNYVPFIVQFLVPTWFPFLKSISFESFVAMLCLFLFFVTIVIIIIIIIVIIIIIIIIIITTSHSQ